MSRKPTVGEVEFAIPKRTPQPGGNDAGQMKHEMRTQHTDSGRPLVRRMGVTGKVNLTGVSRPFTEKMERHNDSSMAEIGDFKGRKKRASGGHCAADGGHWIQKAIKKPGALHRELGVPMGEKIPRKMEIKASHSTNPTLRRRANLALTLNKLRPK